MSAALVLPLLWAFAEAPESTQKPDSGRAEPRMSFYRRYTEALLRRYLRMSMEAGRVPSLLGREMFRARITSYRVQSFEDVVIFLYDIERCLQQLDEEQQHLIARITLQEYSLMEAARLLGLPPRTAVRRYCRALDRLTRIFLETQMLEPLKRCQERKRSKNHVND